MKITMKTLVTCSALLCTTTVVHAASLQWGGAVAVPGDKTGSITPDSISVLLWSADAFVGDAKAISGLTIGSTSDNGGSVVSTWSITEIQSNNGSFVGQWDNIGNNVDGYYAILVADAKDPTKASYQDMGSISGTKATDSLVPLKFNPDWDTDDFLNMNGYTVVVGGTPEPVPEPTTGILLVLGIAGLALKRKRA